MEEIIEGFFKLPRLRFLTLKGPPGSWQDINKVKDLLKKKSSLFFIVRESNKIADGYHFHAIYSLSTSVEICFKKGVHMYVKNITGDCPTDFGCLSMRDLKEAWDYTSQLPDEDRKLAEDSIEDSIIDLKLENQVSAKRHGDRKRNSISRVVKYMMKELKCPQRYINYATNIPGCDLKRLDIIATPSGSAVTEPLPIGE